MGGVTVINYGLAKMIRKRCLVIRYIMVIIYITALAGDITLNTRAY